MFGPDISQYDYAIIGAGPAGLIATLYLARAGKKVLLIDKGDFINKRICPKQAGESDKCICKTCHILCGIGGAGGKSDGKLILANRPGYDLYSEFDKKIVDKLINDIAYIYTSAAKMQAVKGNRSSSKEELFRECLKNGLKFDIYDEIHIGSDRLKIAIQNIVNDIIKTKNVIILTNTEAEPFGSEILINYNGKRLLVGDIANKIVLALGRGDCDFARFLNLDIEYEFKPLDIGFRVETLNDITNPITSIQYDFKISMRHDDFLVRSYCVNPGGFVVTERHIRNNRQFNLVNGHSFHGKKSNNCNFAVLFTAELTKPQSNTQQFGVEIASVFDCLGDGRPIVQRLKDIYTGRRTTHNRLLRSNVTPTLQSAIPGNLGWAMPYSFMVGIVDYIKKLDNVMPGIADGYNTLVYGPEIKLQAIKFKTSNNFCINKDARLYAIGDFSGKSGSIISASVTGALFALNEGCHGLQ